jgi:hypothetical protein
VHRSRLVAALADVPAALFDREVDFWAGAFGRRPERDPKDQAYAEFSQVSPGLTFMVQSVDDRARFHLDIETDDVAAEVARLEGLGAQRVAPVESWWVMRDPAGLLFCVVRIQDPEHFEALSTTWEP